MAIHNDTPSPERNNPVEVDLSALVYHARTQLRGIQNLAGETDDELESLTGWQLHQLLEPIAEKLTTVLEHMGGDPDRRRRSAILEVSRGKG